jgi:hypothetical protein
MPVDVSQVCGVRWVHVFEDDTPAGEVYRPESVDIPLSRRPRRRFELRPDGSATLFTSGPDDRYVGRMGAWHADDGALMVLFPAAREDDPVRIRIIEGSRTRLLVAPGG